MHCPYCAQELADSSHRCSRCGAKITPQARRHTLTVTIAYALVAILAVAAICYIVLYWRTTQLPVGAPMP